MYFSGNQKFTAPQVKTYSNGIYIEYFVKNADGSVERKLQKANALIRNSGRNSEREQILQQACCELYMQLQQQYNSVASLDGVIDRGSVPLRDALIKFIEYKETDLRHDTMRTYKTAVNKLNAFCAGKVVVCADIDKAWCMALVDTITGVCAKTYNNNIKMFRVVFAWLQEHGYIADNFFTAIKTKKAYKKERCIVDKQLRDRMTAHLAATDPGMLLFLNLIYSSLIRPKEIRNLRIGDIDLVRHRIHVSSDIAKNHHTRYAPVSPFIEELLLKLKIADYPAHYYLFGRKLMPGVTGVSKTVFNRHWAKIKRDLDIQGHAVQMYSFRDSGIFDMLKSGIDDLTVMQAADHSSLEITSIYAKHLDTHLHERLYKAAPEF